jgi:hypothetical protein
LPAQLFWLLIGMALLGMAALGFQLGLRGNPIRALTALLTILWTVVILDILDLATARIGAFRTSAVVYEWTIEGFRGGRVHSAADHAAMTSRGNAEGAMLVGPPRLRLTPSHPSPAAARRSAC